MAGRAFYKFGANASKTEKGKVVGLGLTVLKKMIVSSIA
jgi:hypothetical protein